MPYALTVAAHQMNDSALRHAAKTYKKQTLASPIFMTSQIEADLALMAAKHKKLHMKKRLKDMLQPSHASLSHGLTNPAALYRSLSQVKKRSGRRARHSKVRGSVILMFEWPNALQPHILLCP